MEGFFRNGNISINWYVKRNWKCRKRENTISEILKPIFKSATCILATCLCCQCFFLFITYTFWKRCIFDIFIDTYKTSLPLYIWTSESFSPWHQQWASHSEGQRRGVTITSQTAKPWESLGQGDGVQLRDDERRHPVHGQQCGTEY